MAEKWQSSFVLSSLMVSHVFNPSHDIPTSYRPTPERGNSSPSLSPSPPNLLIHQTQLPSRRPRSSFLLLVLDKFYVIFGYDRVLLQQELFNLLAHIALYYDLLSSAGNLRYRRTCSEFLAEVLGDFLVFETECFEPGYGCDEFALLRRMESVVCWILRWDGEGKHVDCGAWQERIQVQGCLIDLSIR